MWNQTIGDATVQCGADLEKVYPTWREWPAPLRDKLTKAVHLAPTMVSDAIQALRAHSLRHTSSLAFRRAKDRLQGQLAKDPSVVNVDHTEVGQGLIKYFNLKNSAFVTDIYWMRVQNICSVFEKIDRGLKKGYTLQVNYMADRGKVIGQTQSTAMDVSPIREQFGFDREWGNRKYFPLIQSDIVISAEWVSSAREPSFVARTIVHEASHKWAFTKDILYKDNRRSATESDVEKIARDGKAKALLPMTGYLEQVERLDPADEYKFIDPVRLLENADSYAWFARRMSKRLGNFVKVRR